MSAMDSFGRHDSRSDMLAARKPAWFDRQAHGLRSPPDIRGNKPGGRAMPIRTLKTTSRSCRSLYFPKTIVMVDRSTRVVRSGSKSVFE